MRLIYQLSEELAQDPQQVEKAQALTLDKSRPTMGLKGSHGLFGSPVWWENIENGSLPTKNISGTIKRTYIAGQDESEVDNAFDLLCDDGSIIQESCYVNNQSNISIYQAGRRVLIKYALDELKQPRRDGQPDHSLIPIEVWVDGGDVG